VHPARPGRRRAVGWPPAAVRQVSDTFLSLVDEAAPDLVEGVYLHGSLGFGEWYDGRSDIDYVAVLARRPDDRLVDLLRDVHARLAETFPRPPFDGFHLTWDDLAGSPYACPDLPCTQAGYFHPEARLDVHPVTWHELASHGVTVRGPDVSTLDIWTDRRALRAYTHENLGAYWRPEVEQLRRFPGEAARPEIVTWFVLGVSRLHHLLATDRLTSKTGAGRYALEAFDDRWRPIVTEALVYRELEESTGEYDGEPARRARETVEFAEMAVASGLAITV
jgi:predicted nucleotidyltransferase